MLFFLSFFCFTIGIVCGINPNISLWIELSLFFSLIIIFFGGWKRLYIVTLSVSVTLFGWYLWHSDYHSREIELSLLSQETMWFSGTYTVTGKVEKLLYTTDLSNTYRLHIDKIDNISTKKTKNLEDKNIGILFEIPKNLHISVGDTIEYTGKITDVIKYPLSWFSSYSWYNRAYWKSTVPIFQRLIKSNPNILYSIQLWSKWVIFRGFPENIAGIILWMTIWNIELLSSETKKYFTNAGITHILVVSGSNIAFVIIILTGMLRYIPIWRWLRMGVVVIFVIIYGSLVGWDMPVIRAVAMGLITYMAIEGWKKASSIAILFAVGFWILIYSPLALLYDAWFWLSFSGTLGILLFHSPIQSLITKKYIPKFLVDIVSVTIAASIGSMIAIIYHFGTIPVYTLFSNILISGVLGWILFSSILYLIFALIGWWILYLWWWTIYIPTAYIMWVGSFFGNNYTYTLDENWTEPISLFCIGIIISVVFMMEKVKLLESK